MSEAFHSLVLLEHIAAKATHTGESGTLSQDPRQHRSETDSAPIVGDHERELGGIRVCATNITSFRHERRGLIHGAIMKLSDERNMRTRVGRRELPQELLREFIDRAVKSQSACCARQRCKECPQRIQIGRLDPSDGDPSRIIELYLHESLSLFCEDRARLLHRDGPSAASAPLGLTLAFAPLSTASSKSAVGNRSLIALTRSSGVFALASSSSKISKYD